MNRATSARMYLAPAQAEAQAVDRVAAENIASTPNIISETK
jgi:hypothetical protein